MCSRVQAGQVKGPHELLPQGTVLEGRAIFLSVHKELVQQGPPLPSLLPTQDFPVVWGTDGGSSRA